MKDIMLITIRTTGCFPAMADMVHNLFPDAEITMQRLGRVSETAEDEDEVGGSPAVGPTLSDAAFQAALANLTPLQRKAYDFLGDTARRRLEVDQAIGVTRNGHKTMRELVELGLAVEPHRGVWYRANLPRPPRIPSIEEAKARKERGE